MKSRSPHGERGLKFYDLSHGVAPFCRSPHGERGLKSALFISHDTERAGRSPHGERGLKYLWLNTEGEDNRSLPTRGAWIEIAARWWSCS